MSHDTTYNNYGWVDEPFAPRKEPKKSHRESHIAPGTAAALAKESGASDTALVENYLVQCADVADAHNSIASSRRNQPALFEQRARSTSQGWVRPQRGSKHR